MQTLRQPVFPGAGSSEIFDPVLPVRLGFEGHRMIVNALFRFAGAGLILMAPGLWLLPSAHAEMPLMLFKLGASIFFGFCGMALLLRNRVHSLPEVYFDPRRREMRVMRKNRAGRPQTILLRRYDSLGAARFTRSWLEIWDVDGSVLVSLPLSDPDARSALRVQLAEIVK